MLHFAVKSSATFSKFISTFQCLVSFDMVCLFTSVTIDKTLLIIANLLLSDATLMRVLNLLKMIFYLWSVLNCVSSLSFFISKFFEPVKFLELR